MPARPSYEPSVQVMLAEALPAGSRAIAASHDLRRRVSWPVAVRSTGLGRLEGGEAVLVPRARADAVLSQLPSLGQAGVAAVVLEADLLLLAEPVPGIALLTVPPGTDLRRLREDLERYIARRRRALFSFEQEVHHELVDAAVAGADLPELLAAASRLAGTALVLDRDGDVLAAPGAETPGERALAAARLACRDALGPVLVPGPPPALAVAVETGRMLRGVAVALSPGDSGIDEAEVVLASFAAAAGIALARVPARTIPSLDDVLADSARAGSGWSPLGATTTGATTTGATTTGAATTGPPLRAGPSDPAEPVLALAVRDPGAGVTRLESALAAALQARSLDAVIGLQGETIVACIQSDARLPADALLRDLARRLSVAEVDAGLGRARTGIVGARQSAREALEALRLGAGGLTRFETVELRALLEAVPGWEEYVQQQLGALLATPVLLETLAAYLREGRNGTAAAAVLHVHRNTMLYRLRRLRDLLGVDPDCPRQAFALELALQLLEAHGGISAAADSG